MVLVVDHQIEQQPLGGGQRLDHPAGQTVGAYGDAQRRHGGNRAGQIDGKRLFQQRHLGHMAHKAQARRRGGAGLAPADQHAAHPLLQCLDTLGNGRSGHADFRRGQIEAAGAVNSRKRGKQGVFKHGIRIS